MVANILYFARSLYICLYVRFFQHDSITDLQVAVRKCNKRWVWSSKGEEFGKGPLAA